MNVWEKSEDSVGYIQAAWRSLDSTGLSLGKWKDTVHTVHTLSNKWEEKKLLGFSPSSVSIPPLPRKLKTRSALRVVFISELAWLCIRETPGQENSQRFLRAALLDCKKASQGAVHNRYQLVHICTALGWFTSSCTPECTSKQQCISAFHEDPTNIAVTLNWHRVEIIHSCSNAMGKKVQGFKIINISEKEKWVLRVSQDESVLASIAREAKWGMCVLIN